jgi:hypothetical protein
MRGRWIVLKRFFAATHVTASLQQIVASQLRAQKPMP